MSHPFLTAAEAYAKARKAWAEAFLLYRNGLSGMTDNQAKAMADAEWIETVIKAEAMYEFYKKFGDQLGDAPAA